MALSVLYPPRGSTAVSTLDVVAVHGLGGDAIDTWTHPKSNAFWLKDFLPTQVPDARVLTFGYNAAAAFGRSTSGVIDHAKSLLSSLVDKRDEAEEKDRPLIFVAHSLGGIVVKEALLQSRLEPRYQSICDATLGLIFFGTPHRGSEKAAYGNILANIANGVTRQPSSGLPKALQTNSDVLLRLTSDFKHQLPRYHVVSFFEQRPMKMFKDLIVEKHSALLEVPNEEQIPVDADHSAMCKFEREEDDTFERVYKRIRRMRSNPRPTVTGQMVSYNKHFEIPHLVSPVFTGRDDILRNLHQAFDGSQVRERVQRRFVLSGLGGSGKTQICLKYAQDHREWYWGVFWIDASTSDTIQRSFKDIAQVIHADADAGTGADADASIAINSVKRQLTNASDRWLLIYDNADDPRLPLTPYFPTGDRGDIIITSRNPGHAQYGTVGSEKIGQMSLGDATALLVKITHGTMVVDQWILTDGQTVVETLGGLALAISQAGAYIRETGRTYEDYLELYKRRRREIMAYHPAHAGTDYRYTVYTTWQVSVDMIESRHDTTSDHALHLLKLLCFYHHEQVPLQMFYKAWQNTQIDLTSPKLTFRDDVTSEFDYREVVQASVTLLASFSLISRGSDMSVSLHSLVHTWYQDSMVDDERTVCLRRATSLLAQSVKWRFQTEDYMFRRSLTPHVRACLYSDKLDRKGIDDHTPDEWSNMALVLGENGWTREALQLTEQVVELRKSKLGEDHPDTLMSMNNLAVRYSEAGRRSEALELTEQVLELHKGKLGEDHPDTLTSMHNLANRYSEAGRRSEALELTEQVLELHKGKLEEDHPDTLSSINNLAVLYSEAGRRSEGLELTEQVLELRKSKLGEDHPDTLMSMNNLAIRYSEAGRGSEALELTEQVVELRKSKLGEDHPDTLSSINNLAVLYSEAGRRSKGLELTEQVLELRKSKLGEDHPDTLMSMNNLAIRYSEAGRRSEALELTEQVVELHKSKLGEDHPDTVRSMNNLAVRYSEAGRRPEALQLMEQVVELHKSKLGEDHPDTLMSMNNLAVRYSEAGRRSEALELTEQVLELRKSKLGEDHPDTLTSMHNLAIRYSEAGRRSEALELTEQVLELHKGKLGEDHPDTLTSMHNLANRYSEAGRRSEALELTEQVLELRKSKLGEDHPDTLMSMNNLAIRYSEAGRGSEALELTEQVVELRKSKLGEEHPDTLSSMHNLAIRYSEAGRRSEALELTEQVVKLRKSKLGEDHPDTLRSMHNLAIRYSEAGRRSEALELTEQVMELHKSKLGEDHPDTQSALKLLAFLSELGSNSQQNFNRQSQSPRRISRFQRLFRFRGS